MAAGTHHSLAIKTDGSLWTWGDNGSGQLGDGTTTNGLLPVQILTGVAAIAGGMYHTLARKTDDSLWAWGGNFEGQLGDNSITPRHSPVQVSGFGAQPRPDFAITSAILTPSGPIANATFSAAVTVKNQGAAAGTPGTLQVWSNQPAAQACGAVGNKSVVLASLAAGASRTVTLTGLPAGPIGAKTLRAFVDSQCQTAEANDANNQSTRAYSVFAGPIPGFVVTSLVLTPLSPKANGTFSATVTVKNQGSGSGNGGTLAVWASQPAAQVCPATGNANIVVGALTAGASKVITVAGLPAGAAGAKTLRTFVDSKCLTPESYDGNNQAVKPYTVIP